MKKTNQYFEKVKTGREEIAKYQKEKSIIGDLSGVPGIGELPEEFIEALGLRAILRGVNGKEIILPSVGKNTYYFKTLIAEILSINPHKILSGDFRDLIINQKDREPYIKTEYYFDISTAPEETIGIINAVRKLGNKGHFMQMMKKIDHKIIPDETKIYEGIYINGEYLLPDDLIKDAKNRISKRKSFIIKGGDGASGTNMIVFKYLKDNNEYQIISPIGKFYKSRSELTKQEIAKILRNSIEDKWTNFINSKTRKNLNKPQLYVIQQLVDKNVYEERSLGLFVITDENGNIEVRSTYFSANLTEGTIHVGNKELPISINNSFNKIENAIKNIIKQINEEFKINFVGPIGLDMFVNKQNTEDIKIIECNARYTAPSTPSMFVHRLEKVTGIKNLFRNLLQKFKTKTDLRKKENNHPKIREYNLLFNGLNSLLKHGIGFLPYTPFRSNTQGIIIVGTNKKDMKKLKELLSKYTNGGN